LIKFFPSLAQVFYLVKILMGYNSHKIRRTEMKKENKTGKRKIIAPYLAIGLSTTLLQNSVA